MQREVDGKVYWSLSTKELRDYFEKNKAKFTKPETVTLSEIFLNLAGRDKATPMEKAKQIVAELPKAVISRNLPWKIQIDRMLKKLKERLELLHLLI